MSEDKRHRVVMGPYETRDEAYKRARWLVDYRKAEIVEGGQEADGFWRFVALVGRIEDTDHEIPGEFPCGRCAATGRFITYVENGVPKGPGGMCFRCQGKGMHTREDRRRNEYHDRHYTGGIR